MIATTAQGRHRRRARSRPAGTWMRTRDPELLRRAIAARRLTYRETAKLAGISTGFLSHLLPSDSDPDRRPRKPGCKPETADRIAAALRLPVEVLFFEGGRGEASTGPIPVVTAPSAPSLTSRRHRSDDQGVA